MPCNTRRYTQQVRDRAISRLRDRLSQADVTVDSVDPLTGDVRFSATTADGLTLSATLDARDQIVDATIGGWTLQERAGWCDGCSMEYLSGTSGLDRIIKQARQGAAAVTTFGTDALTIKV